MGVGCRIFVESSGIISSSGEFRWEYHGPTDFLSAHKLPEQQFAVGLIIPRGRTLYEMLGYPDGRRIPLGYDQLPLGVSALVRGHAKLIAGVGGFWSALSHEEIKIVQRCWVAHEHENLNRFRLSDLSSEDAQTWAENYEHPERWPVTLSGVLAMMETIVSTGALARAIVRIE